MTRTIPALILLLMFPSFSFTKQVVAFPSGRRTLHGIIFRPQGKGPFPALVYNHGSYKDPTQAIEILGPVFAARGWVLFAPYRRGQGLSRAEGPFIGDEIAAARNTGGLTAAAATMVRRLRTDQLNDQLAALAWLKTQDFVAPDRIAVAGNSFGGIESLLGAERGGYCAAVDASGGAESWALSSELRDLMTHAVRNRASPFSFFRPPTTMIYRLVGNCRQS